MANFTIASGKIIAPNGAPFLAKGINTGQGMDLAQWMTLAQASLLTTFPNLNFIRLNAAGFANYQPPSYYEAFINWATSKQIVVLIEDHVAGIDPDPLYTAAQLTAAVSWYAALAKAFAANSWLWFGTMNEPGVAPTAQQVATYQAIRGAGNNSIVAMELVGGGDTFALGAGNQQGNYPSSAYQAMTGIIWDLHFYSAGATSEAGEAAALAASIALVNQIGSADGQMPILLGEIGNSGSGSGIDPDGANAVAAAWATIGKSTVGAACWAWEPGGTGDRLLNNSTTGGPAQLTAYGQQVAALIATNTGTPAMPASAQNTTAPPAAAITDTAGNAWMITAAGQVAVNGTADTTTSGVTELAWVGSTIWQKNGAGLWWGKTSPSAAWAPAAGTSTSPLPAPPPPTPVPPTGPTAAQLAAAQATVKTQAGVITAAAAAIEAAVAGL